ncbi:hypothetical protein UPYG_G00081490 [Umbra pygmaea]|uniref:Uncharacterized protein n=1 Tax=Umbra pygmaea TaxID=75934 RepID=A0ABD0XGT6_UMBPY
MEPTQKLGGSLWKIFFFALFANGSGEYDRYFQLCGTWRHGNKQLTLSHDIKRGCGNIIISANESSLSIQGQITAQCENNSVFNLGLGPEAKESHFCVYWEPLLDQMLVEVNKWNYTLCWPTVTQKCCTDLSQGPDQGTAAYGIQNASQRGDVISYKTHRGFSFYGHIVDCKQEFNDKKNPGPRIQMNKTDDPVMSTKVLPHAQISVVEMNLDFHGYTIAPPVPQEYSVARITSVYLPSYLKPLEKDKVDVVCIFFKHSTLFQAPFNAYNKDWILEDVVGITVENEIITNLPEPVRIGYHHSVIPTTHSRKCVSWDTKKDPNIVTWREEGCETFWKSNEDTECRCKHLTYFAILVQLKTGPVRHLWALTTITSIGCAASTFSCIILIVYLCKNMRKFKEPTSGSTSVHLGLAIALFLLSLLFFLTGTVANVGGTNACWLFGAFLHYSLLSSFSWMAIEVFHTFWLVYMVFRPSPKSYFLHLIGFGLPAIPVIVLLVIGVYGVREVVPTEDMNNPYLMCWMDTSPGSVGLLAHYFTTITLMAAVVFSGLVMLFLVLRKIQNRDEWRRNKMAFLSIWGLSCLFGTTWGLGFLDFGPLSEFILFLFCILNSLQGFFLMLRFYILHRMQKDSRLAGTSSTGSSTRQHMLQEPS